MANSEHEKIVKLGANAVNAWHQVNPDSRLNLESSDLSGLNLEGAILNYANIVNANLSNTRLSGCCFQGVDFQNANLSEADLTKTKIRFSDFTETILTKCKFDESIVLNNLFSETNLSKASLKKIRALCNNFLTCNMEETDCSDSIFKGNNFVGSNLKKASFHNAILSFSNFEGCDFENTDFTDGKIQYVSFNIVDLNKIIGLETIKHESYSKVDFLTMKMTFVNSNCKFTETVKSFLTSTGIPKSLVDGIPSIILGSKYSSCFISYGQPDVNFATKLVNDLRAKGVSCWLYALDSTAGKRTWQEITSKRREAEKMVILCSMKALIREGVKKEIEEQLDEDSEKLIPISLDIDWKNDGFEVKRGGRDLKPFLLELNYADFALNDYDSALNRLLKAIHST